MFDWGLNTHFTYDEFLFSRTETASLLWKKKNLFKTSVIIVLQNNCGGNSHKIYRKTPRKAFKRGLQNFVQILMDRKFQLPHKGLNCKLLISYMQCSYLNILNAVLNPSKLASCIGCKKFVVHTLLWSQEIVIHQNREHSTSSVSNLDRS